ncbi:MAG TPA: single-stranded DNA-binding protein [Candidatus Omnitrophica bacterium]|nr:single-stranded DNA-binding protein [Candidatus Omnitrophota bacterium]
MVNYNKVLLMGNLTRDPELRFTTSGNPVTNLRMAVNRVFTGGDGERKEETCFVTVVVWGKQAESCAEYLTKGKPIFVEGRLRSRSFEVEEGKNRNILEVVAERVQFLGRVRKEEEPPEPVKEPSEELATSEEESLEEGTENSEHS